MQAKPGGQERYRFSTGSSANRPTENRAGFAAPDDDLQDRLVLQFGECGGGGAPCLEDGVVQRPGPRGRRRHFSAPVFAPYTGRSDFDTRGKRGIHATVQRLEIPGGRRFGPPVSPPHPGWRKPVKIQGSRYRRELQRVATLRRSPANPGQSRPRWSCGGLPSSSKLHAYPGSPLFPCAPRRRPPR